MPNYAPKPGLLMTEIEGEAVLLDMESSYYFSLNETGTFIWRAIEDGKEESEIVTGLVAQWDVSADEAARTVAQFVGTLREEGLLRS